eukprot:symbB.v1.2.007896.t1/scaffold489.1/size197246/14
MPGKCQGGFDLVGSEHPAALGSWPRQVKLGQLGIGTSHATRALLTTFLLNVTVAPEILEGVLGHRLAADLEELGILWRPGEIRSIFFS